MGTHSRSWTDVAYTEVPHFLLKTTVTREINSLGMILQIMRKFFVAGYRSLNTGNNGIEQNFHVMSHLRLQRKKSIN